MDFDHSTQRNRWMIHPHENGHAVLTDDEQKLRLLARACVLKINQIGQSQKYSKNVILTSMAYAKRYILSVGTSIITDSRVSDISLLIVTCIYLAGKVEEVPMTDISQRGVDMDKLCKLVQNRTRSADIWKRDAIRNEMALLVGLNFDLLCFHPLRSCNGYYEELVKKGNNLPDAAKSKLEAAFWQSCMACYLHDDLVFKYGPGVLGAACLVYSCASIPEGHGLKNALETVTEVLADVNIDTPGIGNVRELVQTLAKEIEQTISPALDKSALDAYNVFAKRA